MSDKKDQTTNKVNVWWLSATSFFTDISSEMIFPILPIFLKNVLGASYATIGLIEGVAEGLASFLKYFSGYVSDLTRRRKGLTLIGYGLSALSKLFFALANSPFTVLLFRSLDRVGKGVRTSPRDALIAESVAAHERGKYFGFHRASDTAGAIIGTLVTVFVLYYAETSYLQPDLSSNIIRLIFILSFIPAIIGFLLLFFVREVKTSGPVSFQKRPLFQFGKFSGDFKFFLLVAALFGLANYSYSFYILKADELKLAVFLIPLVYLIYNILYAASAYPAGKLSDRIGRTPVLAAAFILFALINVGFAYNQEIVYLWPLFGLYGLFLGLTDGVLKAFVSDLAAKESQGEAFGLYHTVIGFTTLTGNAVGGFIWKLYGSVYPFLLSGFLIALAAILLWLKFYQHNGFKTKTSPQDFKGYRS